MSSENTNQDKVKIMVEVKYLPKVIEFFKKEAQKNYNNIQILDKCAHPILLSFIKYCKKNDHHSIQEYISKYQTNELNLSEFSLKDLSILFNKDTIELEFKQKFKEIWSKFLEEYCLIIQNDKKIIKKQDIIQALTILQQELKQDQPYTKIDKTLQCQFQIDVDFLQKKQKI